MPSLSRRPTWVTMRHRIQLIEHCRLFGKGDLLTKSWLKGVSPDLTFAVASNVAWIMYYEQIPVPQWFLNAYHVEPSFHTPMNPSDRVFYTQNGEVLRQSNMQRMTLTAYNQVRSHM